MMYLALFVPAFAAPQPWPVVLKGVLEGFGLTKDLQDVETCLATVEADEDENIRAAVRLLSKKDARDVLDGLGKLGAALEALPFALQHCDAAARDIKDEAPKLISALAALSNPKDFAYHVGKDLIVNHADIFAEITAAIDAYQQQHWEDFGKSTGAALSKLLVGKALLARKAPQLLLLAEANSTNSTNRTKMDKHQLKILLMGVLEGFGLNMTKDLDLMKGCLNQTEAEVHEVQAAIELLAKRTAKDVIDGLAALGAALGELPAAISNCTAAAMDVKDKAPKLLQALQTLEHPKEFAYHVGKDLIINHADIFAEISSAIDAYQHAEWRSCGNYTGIALAEILIGEKPKLVSILV